MQPQLSYLDSFFFNVRFAMGRIHRAIFRLTTKRYSDAFPDAPIVLAASTDEISLASADGIELRLGFVVGTYGMDKRNSEPSPATAEQPLYIADCLVRDPAAGRHWSRFDGGEALCLTQDQIITFVETQPERLADSHPTMFFFKGFGSDREPSFFTAHVSIRDYKGQQLPEPRVDILSGLQVPDKGARVVVPKGARKLLTEL